MSKFAALNAVAQPRGPLISVLSVITLILLLVAQPQGEAFNLRGYAVRTIAVKVEMEGGVVQRQQIHVVSRSCAKVSMAPARFCNKCRKEKDVSAQNWKAKFGNNGFEITANCRKCLDKAANTMRQNRGAVEKENPENKDDALDFIGVDVLPVDTYLEALSEAGDVNSLSALIDILSLLEQNEKDDSEQTEEDGIEEKELTDKLARLVWDAISYRFLTTIRFEYNCAQSSSRQHKPKKSATAKHLDKAQFKTFPCEGWLTIWAASGDTQCFVRVRHQECRQQYVSIDVPEDVKKYITDNPNMPVEGGTQVLSAARLYQKGGVLAVYNLWFQQQQTQWRRHNDEVQSARILLKEFSAHGSVYEAEPIPIPQDQNDGLTATCFALPSLLRKWGGKIREMALDSTFNTNKAGFECYALLSEVFGSGLPLGFLFLKSKNPEPGKKELYIRSLVKHFVFHWEIKSIPSQLMMGKFGSVQVQQFAEPRT
ncbi:hypothetical protein C8F04DRAFT_1176812 [Mycena alexandri]|uniref:Uncharacterized protein n=1 Tax=Mycena alexandri TaxID=1745969 RepID=A0AAD6XAX3_9AGAR|nr:hypothetical protein C8F04DRAFT_1176812 [Mycena alexandri]